LPLKKRDQKACRLKAMMLSTKPTLRYLKRYAEPWTIEVEPGWQDEWYHHQADQLGQRAFVFSHRYFSSPQCSSRGAILDVYSALMKLGAKRPTAYLMP
jgi:hypothetical protein